MTSGVGIKPDICISFRMVLKSFFLTGFLKMNETVNYDVYIFSSAVCI